MLKKYLHFLGNKLQLLHAIKSIDRPKQFIFATDALHEIDIVKRCPQNNAFSDEVIFQACGMFVKISEYRLLKILTPTLSTNVTPLRQM